MYLEILVVVITLGLVAAMASGMLDLLGGISIYMATGAILWGMKNVSMWESNPYSWFGVIKGAAGVAFGIILLWLAFKRMS